MASPAPTEVSASAPPSRPKIRVWLTVALVSAVAAAGLFGVFAERDFRTHTRAATRELLRSISVAHTDGLSMMMAEDVAATRAFASGDAVRNALNADLPRSLRHAEQLRMERMLRYTAKLYNNVNLMVLDSTLRTVAYFTHDDGQSAAVRPALEQAVRERRSVSVPIHLDAYGVLEFGVVSPVFIDNDSTQAMLGLVYSTIDLNHGLLPGLIQHGTLDAPVESTMLQADGDSVIVFWAGGTPQDPSVRLTRLALTDTQYFSVRAMQTRTSQLLRGLDFRGVDALAYTAPVPGTRWVTTSKIAYADAEARIRLMRTLGAIMWLMFGTLAAVFGRALYLDRQREFDRLQLLVGERAARVLHSSLDGYLALDAQGRIVEVNAALAGMTGYTVDELLGRRLHDVKVADSPAEVDATLARFREMLEGTHYTSIWRRKDGSAITIAVSGRYLPDTEGGRIVGFVRDITDDLAREQRLLRLNQLYVLINRVTEALFSARTPSEAYEATCRLAVESSDFKLAWIGVVRAEDRTVQPLAVHGHDERDIGHIILGLDEGTPMSGGTTPRCFRSGRPEVENDLLGRDARAPWHDVARRYGAYSAGAFPVIVDDQVIAVLTLYHPERHYFQPDEVAILQAVGRFLGSVLQSLAAQARQRAEQERFRLLFDASVLPMMVTDSATGRTLRINPAYTATFGWTIDDVPYFAHRLQLAYPDPNYRAEKLAMLNEAVASLDAGETSFRFPLVHVHCKNGLTRTVQGFIAKVGAELLHGWVDVTDLRRSQALLSESQEIARLLSWEYHFADDSIHFADPALDAWVREAFPSGREWITNAARDEDQALARDAFAAALREHQPADFTIRQLRDDGTERYRRLRVRFEYDATGAPVRAVGSSQDVTTDTLTANELERHRHHLEALVAARTAALKAAYDEVASSDRRFAFAMEASAAGIWDYDVPAAIVTYSNEYCKILGYEPGALPSSADDWIDRVHPEDRTRVDSDFRGLFEQDDARTFEFRMRRRDRSYIWAEATGRVMSRDAAGNATRVVGTLIDLSERRAAEDALRAAKESADEANRAKSAFLAMMSHEIRTPLNGVIGMAEVLEQSPLPAQEADAVRIIRSSAANLLGLIDDILDFSKIEAGRLELEQTDVDVEEGVDSVIASLGPVAASRKVDVFVFVDPSLPRRIVSDGTRLRQIIYNLMGNAIKFSGNRSDRRGRVALRLVRLEGPPAQLRITVADNGIGISEEGRARLFQSFMQAETSTTRRFGGTGLGLAICKRLSRLFGGDIDVHSVLGEGTTFTVTLPLRPAEDQPARALPDVAGLSCIIVTAASDLGEADNYATYLRHGGAVVERAGSDETAARIAAELPAPAVVVQAAPEHGAPAAVTYADADIRHVHITDGLHRTARVITPTLVELDRAGVREETLRSAVAIAAGRISHEHVAEREHQPLITPVGPHRTVDEARRAGRLILVAEDDETNQKVITRQLDMLGFTGEVVANGVEALARWRTGGVAVILSDLHMPEMDGYALTEAIRQEEPAGTRIPILALTANALREEEIRAKAIGMDAYLTKPIRLADLKAALVTWMDADAAERARRASPRLTPSETQSIATARVAVEAVPMVDLSVLRNLVGDDPTVLHGLLLEFRETARRALAEFRSAHAGQDIAIVAAVAHRLKSGARSVGALTLGEHCSALERAARRRDAEALERGLPEVDAELVALDGELAALLNSLFTPQTGP
ncbi:MAG: PAS domain S-box protein [Gemmatimonadetes bacterium]|nr:PAS domain S-box protein [Gemmatimonadota bacterium]